MKTNLALLSLFCGPGGMDEGFLQAGFATVLAYDVDVASINTYNHNHSASFSAELDDVPTLRAGEVPAWLRVHFERSNLVLSPVAAIVPDNEQLLIQDTHTKYVLQIDHRTVKVHAHQIARKADLSQLSTTQVLSDWAAISTSPPMGVIGGPPCQSFSIGNVHQSDTDPRHQLPEHYAAILHDLTEHYELDFFVFENVPGLVTKKHKEKFDRFKTLFGEAGFRIFSGSLNAKDFSVAQERRRVFIVGVNRNKYPDITFSFPTGNGEKPRTVRNAIGDLPNPTFFNRRLSEEDILHHPNHWCMVPRSSKFTTGSLKPGTGQGRSFRVLDWDMPSYTVAYGHREVHIHPDCKRRLSVYEAMLLQGFPKKYVLKGTLSDQIRLVSQAVSPPVAKALADAIVVQLGLLKRGQSSS